MVGAKSAVVQEAPFAHVLFVPACVGWLGLLTALLVPNLSLWRFLERPRVVTLESRYDRFQQELRAVYPELHQLDSRPFISWFAHEWTTGRKGSRVRLRIGVEEAESPSGVFSLRIGVGPCNDETKREVEELAGVVDRFLLPSFADRTRIDRIEEEDMDAALTEAGIGPDA